MASRKKVDRAKLLVRVKALLTLAANDGATEHERRTAAATAARLMHEHKIGLEDASAAAEPPPAPSPMRRRSNPTVATVAGEIVMGALSDPKNRPAIEAFAGRAFDELLRRFTR